MLFARSGGVTNVLVIQKCLRISIIIAGHTFPAAEHKTQEKIGYEYHIPFCSRFIDVKCKIPGCLQGVAIVP